MSDFRFQDEDSPPSPAPKPPAKRPRRVVKVIAPQTPEAKTEPQEFKPLPPQIPSFSTSAREAKARPKATKAPKISIPRLEKAEGQSKRSQAWSGAQTAAQYIFWAALMVVAIVLFNLVFDVAKGSKNNIAANPNANQLTAYLSFLSFVLQGALLLLALSYLLLSFEEALAGWLLLGCGLALHIGAPWLLFAMAGRTAATAGVAGGFRNGGFALAILGAAKLAWDGFIWLRVLPERNAGSASVGVPHRAETAEQNRLASIATVFSPCWHLPYCRSAVRDICPAFLAKTKCWKFGRGCYCDDEMIANIIRGEALAVFQAHIKRAKANKPPCGQCYIYLEHQNHKLRWVSPLVLPVTVSLMFFIWPLYSWIWNGTIKGMTGLWGALSFSPMVAMGPPAQDALTGGNATRFSPEQVALIAQTMFGLLLGFAVFIGLLKLVERGIYRLKW